MPRLVTAHRADQTLQFAHQYVKTYILFPAGLVGLPCMLAGVGGLAYQMIGSDNYTWNTFYQSSGQLVLGIALGVIQTRYHRYLLREFPEVFAARIRDRLTRKRGKNKKEAATTEFDHPGRGWIPLAYVTGITLLVGSGIAVYSYGAVNAFPAFLLPWAGFYWARLFSWRKIIK